MSRDLIRIVDLVKVYGHPPAEVRVLNGVTLDRDHYYNARYYMPTYGEYLTTRKRSA